MLQRPFLFVLWLFSLIPRGIQAAVRALRRFLKDAADLFATYQRKQRKKQRRWFFHIGKPQEWKDHDLTREQLDRLMRRGKKLLDVDDLTRMGQRLVLPEEDFTVTR